MLCAIVKGPSLQEAHQQIQNALPHAESLELRLDFFDSLDIRALREAYRAIPMIFTFRPNNKRTEEERLKELDQLCRFQPDFVDIEWETGPSAIKRLQQSHPSVRWIVSYHHFGETPQDIPSLLQKMRCIPADLYKIAVLGKNASDALRLIIDGRSDDVIPISMGNAGFISRVLPSPFMYAAADSSAFTAPGQLTIQELCETYHLGKNHQLFGLIGNRVEKSISHLSHNALMKDLGIPGTYVKIPVETEDLGAFMALAKKSPLKGLSVTMPHKEAVIPYLDEIDPLAQEIGAVNTLVFENQRVKGYNTDACGAVDALEENLTGKKVILLGAGGAALAIANEAKRRGADVILLTRNPSKRKCDGSLEDFGKFAYDIVINCTPSGLPIDPALLRNDCTVMDITTLPKDTELLVEAKKRGCRIVYGYKMFVNQAVEQFRLWFKDSYPPELIRSTLMMHCEKIV